MKKNLLRKIIGGLCFTSIAFVFQACYGTPQDFGNDLFVEGKVTSKATGLPVKGIKISAPDFGQYTFTGDDGAFALYTGNNVKLVFEDVDGAENSNYQPMDTVVANNADRVFLDIQLNLK